MKKDQKRKDVIQSYAMTVAKYHYHAWEKRVMYGLVDFMQQIVEGKKLSDDFTIAKTVFGDREFKLSLSFFVPNTEMFAGEVEKGYPNLKNALKSLQKKIFEYNHNGEWASLSIIANPRIKKDGCVTFIMAKEMIEAFLCFKEILTGKIQYKRYQLHTAMELKSIYSMRFYEIMSGNTEPITWSIENLKDRFGITDRYNDIKDFKKRVIRPAKAELDKKSPYSFDYKFEKLNQAHPRKVTHITLIPVYISENRDKDLETKRINSKYKVNTNILDKLPVIVKDYLTRNFGFSVTELRNNSNLIENALKTQNIADFSDELANIKARALTENVKNPKGYVINALKLMVKQSEDTNKEKDTTIRTSKRGEKNKTYTPEELAAALEKSNIEK